MEAARLFILRRIIPEDRGHPTPCWIWQGTKNEKGYARADFGGVKNVRIHRLSYEAYIGPIPDGLQIDHLCFLTSCVNPAHLEPVTNDENARRCAARRTCCKHGHEYTPETTVLTIKGRKCLVCKELRQSPRPPCGPRTHCLKGHEYTPENTVVLPDGGRRCVACRAASQHEYNIHRRQKRAVARANSSAGVGSHGAHATAYSRTIPSHIAHDGVGG